MNIKLKTSIYICCFTASLTALYLQTLDIFIYYHGYFHGAAAFGYGESTGSFSFLGDALWLYKPAAAIIASAVGMIIFSAVFREKRTTFAALSAALAVMLLAFTTLHTPYPGPDITGYGSLLASFVLLSLIRRKKNNNNE